MTGYIPKPIPICRICGMEADSGSLCQNCKDKIKYQRRKAKKK